MSEIWNRRSWLVLRPYLSGALAVLFAGLIVNQLHSWKEVFTTAYRDRHELAFPGSFLDTMWFAFLIVCLSLVLRWWHSFGPDLLFPRTRKYGRRPAAEDPREHLVLFLSNLNSDNSNEDGNPLHYALTENLEEDLKHLASVGRPYWPWEQMLRAVLPHLEKLKAIYCVCSKESFPQASQFKSVLERYSLLERREFRIVLDSKAVVTKFTATAANNGGVDFENFDQLADLLRWLFGYFREQGIRDDSVVVDFTGGQKVASVVAVAETFDRDITAQYVQTGGDKHVYSYDVIVDKISLDVPVK